ncbi:MAG: GNAT family N-acetyltransferase [Neomegalonema sp.]|nr:GNAT family N-acetyltransferase [Neomegalonema sp.]
MTPLPRPALADFLTPPLRPAVSRDAAALATFINMAGEGLPYYLWRKSADASAADATDPWEIGRARQAAKIGKQDIIIAADADDAPIAALAGYLIGEAPEPLDGASRLETPLIDLENNALRSWYVNMLAVAPEYRGRGWGRRLLAHAQSFARACGAREMSIILSDQNIAAHALYTDFGCTERARRKMEKEQWENPSFEWVLLTKPISEGATEGAA